MRQVQIEQGDITLVMNTQGPRKGPTLLFIHSGGESRSVWAPMFSHLRPKHWQLAAPDLRGHGESSCALEYRVDDFIADGYEIIRQLKGRPLVLVGSGMGGVMALLLATQYPLLVDGLVLLDAPTRLSAAAAKRESQKILDGITEKASPASDDQQAADQLVDDILANPERVSQAAQSIAVPTLFMYGSNSNTVAADELRAVRKDIPHVETASVDAGPAMTQDNPAAVAAKIAAFVPTLIAETIH